MTRAATDLKQAIAEARDLDGSMSERLDVLADAMRRLTPELVASIDRLVDRAKRTTPAKERPARGRRHAAFRAARRNRPHGEPGQSL